MFVLSAFWILLHPMNVLEDNQFVYKYNYTVTYSNGDKEKFSYNGYRGLEYLHNGNGETDCISVGGSKVCGVRYFELSNKEVVKEGFKFN